MSDVYIPRLSSSMQRQVAHLMIAKIREDARRHGVGEKDIQAAIDNANLIVKEIIAEGLDAVFINEIDSPDGKNTIKLNPETSEPMGAVLAHEYARFLMWDWLPRAAFDAETVLCHDPEEDNAAARFRLAKMVHRAFLPRSYRKRK